jgi:CHAD domain-containing protein
MTTRCRETGKRKGIGKKPRLWIRRREATGEALRTLATLQLDAALTELRGKNVSPDAVHNARTYIKKIRSLIQLGAPTMGSACRDRLRKKLREAAAVLGPMRDSDVRVQSLDELIRKTSLSAVRFDPIRRRLSDASGKRRSKDRRQIPRVERILREIRKSIPSWPLDKMDGKKIIRRVRRTYRRGRIALDLCSSSGNSVDFHLWRKLVKQLWYQLRITSRFWPDHALNRIRDTDLIGELAGKERDYTLLGKRLIGLHNDPCSVLLVNRINKIIVTLRKKSISEGFRFYEERPKDFVKKLCIP